MAGALLRIGTLSKRTGVSPELLRAWERRYGLLRPERTEGKFRLYSDEDVRRVIAMRDLVASGVSASEAARIVLTNGAARSPAAQSAGVAPLDLGRQELRTALRAFDEPGAHGACDSLLAAFDLEMVIIEVLLPELRILGDDWVAGRATVAQEHFAANLLRGRLMSLARGWGQGVGPMALLACPPGEDHDLPLVIFGLLLRRRGWRVTFLGANTPVMTITETVRRVCPDAVVLSSPLESVFLAAAEGVRETAAVVPVYLGGAGATAAAADATHARQLPAGQRDAAEFLAQRHGRGRSL